MSQRIVLVIAFAFASGSVLACTPSASEDASSPNTPAPASAVTPASALVTLESPAEDYRAAATQVAAEEGSDERQRGASWLRFRAQRAQARIYELRQVSEQSATR